MASHRVIVCCWQHGHKTELSMTLRQEQGLSEKISKLKAVCPECRNIGLGNQPIFILEGQTLFNPSKAYSCTHGHVTTIGAFTNGMLHLKFGMRDEDFVNVTGTIEELSELLDTKDVSCHHIHADGTICDSPLKAIDDTVLSYPVAPGIKTRTRIGDLWDRAGVQPVRPGHYDANGNYKESKTEVANRDRLNKVRERNIAADRHPGKRINKPTAQTYERRSKSQINPDRLAGPQ